MKKLYIDIETYSPVELKKVGVYPYVESPDWRILFACWWYGDPADTILSPPEIQVAMGSLARPDGGWDEIEDALNIPMLYDPSVIKVAHNAQFERVNYSRARMKPGCFLPPEEWHDTAAIAAVKGWPRNLDNLSRALGGEQKDSAGTRLINMFCVPQKRLGGRPYSPEEKPEDWARFIEYGKQDVVTLIDVDLALGDWPTEREKQVFLSDQRLNDRGIALDKAMVKQALDASQENMVLQMAEARSITGLENPNSNVQLLKWFHDQGLLLPNLKAETVEAALDDMSKGLDRKVRRMLYLRQELALVAAKKYITAASSATTGDRLRGQFLYHGAHTGRWAGRGVQLHNLPRYQLPTQADTQAAILDLYMGLGADPLTLKGLVRSMLVGPFTVVDYSAIEARVIAWLAGEEWALEAFRNGRDIYVETAAQMTSRLGGKHKFSRSEGKVAVLALGYNGGVNSLRAMGGSGSDETLQLMVNTWRTANENIVDLWTEMERSFRVGGPVGSFITIEKDGRDRAMVLPSGRAIVYHDVRMQTRTTSWGADKVVPTFIDPRFNNRTSTYGGRLVENATQGVARDVLADALVRLEQRGYAPVGHIHDEILVESEDLEGVKRIMTEVPSWAPGLPVDGEGFVTDRYRKG